MGARNGKSVVFTAAPTTAGYAIKEWTDNGSTVNGTNTTYTIFSIAAAHAVTVEYKLIPCGIE